MEYGVNNGFRVFLSYTHEKPDEKIADEVEMILKDLNQHPVRDKNIQPGAPYMDVIKDMITHSHVFMPIITQLSAARPWVHQEIGYAAALDIPILPLAIGDVPSGMIAQAQALSVKEDLSDLRELLGKVNFDNVVFPLPSGPTFLVDVADPPERRAQLIAQCTRAAIQHEASGLLLQSGALSSFCIPDAGPDDSIWDQREGNKPKTHYHRLLQREERRALEAYAGKYGCMLILDPSISFASSGPGVREARLSTLKQALGDLPQDRVYVVTSSSARSASLTIVGDWFTAESRLPRPGRGYEQTVFNCHAPSVLRSAKDFVARFESLCQKDGVEPCNSLAAFLSRL